MRFRSATGRVERLKQPLVHHPNRRMEDALRRIDEYSTAGAKVLNEGGKRAFFTSGIAHGAAAFLRAIHLRNSDSSTAVRVIWSPSTTRSSSYHKYMKLWLLQRDKKK